MTPLIDYDNVLAALCIWREARGETLAAKQGVYHVILNRANDTRKRWPQKIADVVLQPKQFSSFNAGDPNATKLPARNDLNFLTCCNVVSDPGLDPTGGANAYHSIPANEPQPSWAVPIKLTTRIGALSFYRL